MFKASLGYIRSHCEKNRREGKEGKGGWWGGAPRGNLLETKFRSLCLKE